VTYSLQLQSYVSSQVNCSHFLVHRRRRHGSGNLSPMPPKKFGENIFQVNIIGHFVFPADIVKFRHFVIFFHGEKCLASKVDTAPMPVFWSTVNSRLELELRSRFANMLFACCLFVIKDLSKRIFLLSFLCIHIHHLQAIVIVISSLPPSASFAVCGFCCNYSLRTVAYAILSSQQESCAVAKMTAQCALCMGALKIFGTPCLRPCCIFTATPMKYKLKTKSRLLEQTDRQLHSVTYIY